MKILFVSSGNVQGGPAPFIQQQVMSLENEGVNIDHFQVAARGARGYMSSAYKLRRLLKENKYDLIHAHYSYCGIISDLARTNEKLVVSFMGSDLLGRRHGKILRDWQTHLILAVNRFYARSRYDLVIVKSKGMRERLGLDIPCEVVPNGVDMAVFQPMNQTEARNKLGWPSDKKIILFAADPARPEKNFPLAEKSVALLGDPQALLMPVWQVQHELMNRCFNASDVLLLTSRHEGSPNVVKESMACNLPVISADVGDVREVIADTAGCEVCPPNAEALAAALAMTLGRYQRTDGRERVRNLEISTVARYLIHLYEGVLSI